MNTTGDNSDLLDAQPDDTTDPSNFSSCTISTPSTPLFNGIDNGTLTAFLSLLVSCLLPHALVYYMADVSVYDRGCSVRMDLILMTCMATLVGFVMCMFQVAAVQNNNLRYTNVMTEVLSKSLMCFLLTVFGVFVCMITYQIKCVSFVSTGVLVVYWILTACMMLPTLILSMTGAWYLIYSFTRFIDIIWPGKVPKAEAKFIKEFFLLLKSNYGATEPQMLYLTAVKQTGIESWVITLLMLYYKYYTSYSMIKPATVVPIECEEMQRDQYDSEPSIRRQGGHLAPRMISKGLSSMRDSYKEGVCYICDGSLMRQPLIMQHPVCYHEFHEACFVRYVRGKPSCPRCGIGLYESLNSELTNDIGKQY